MGVASGRNLQLMVTERKPGEPESLYPISTAIEIEHPARAHLVRPSLEAPFTAVFEKETQPNRLINRARSESQVNHERSSVPGREHRLDEPLGTARFEFLKAVANLGWITRRDAQGLKQCAQGFRPGFLHAPVHVRVGILNSVQPGQFVKRKKMPGIHGDLPDRIN